MKYLLYLGIAALVGFGFLPDSEPSKTLEAPVPAITNVEQTPAEQSPETIPVVAEDIAEVIEKAEIVPEKVEPVKEKPTPVVKDTASCGEDYYRNVDGNCIHRPSDDPSGASAKCRDGSYSYSQNRRGTCSGHGGVAQWL